MFPSTNCSLLKKGLVIVSLLLSSQLAAQHLTDRQQPDLPQLVRHGLAVNPKVLAARAELKRAEKSKEVAEWSEWPSLSLSMGPAHGLTGPFAYDVTMQYTLYDWGALEQELAGLDAETRKYLHQLRETREAVGLEIISCYYRLAFLQKKLEFQRRYEQRIATLNAHVEARAARKFSDSAELSRVRQNAYFAAQQKRQLEAKQRTAEQKLKLLLQQPVLPHFVLPERLELITKLVPPQHQRKTFIEQSPQYQIAKASLEIAEASVTKASAEEKPRLLLEAYTQKRDIGGRLTRDSAVAVRFRMDLNNGLASFSLDEVEDLRADSARWGLAFAELEIDQELHAMEDELVSLAKQRETIEQQVFAVEHAAKVYNEQFLAGHSTIEELLRVERERFELQLHFLQVTEDLLMTPYRINAEVGTLDTMLALQSDSRVEWRQ